MATLTTTASSLAEMLLTTRRLIGATTREMAARMGVTHATIANWERGTGEPKFSQMLTWSRITGQPLDVFVEAALQTETAPAEAEAESGLSQHSVRLEGLEPPTFWFGADALDAELQLLLTVESLVVES